MSASEATLGGLPIAAGDVLLKKYRVERLIGEGGTGIVLSATHVQLEQRVAIKFLRRALESDELRTRFEREARAMGKIESDHVVLVLDAGALDDGAPYMVMEYLDGRDLARVLKEDGPLPVEEAVDCMLQVCEALRQAHAAGIVHRDLKPANLFLTRRDDDDAVHVKVVDFGISKILDRKLTDDGNPHEVTTAFTMLGSPRYMAPEQVKNSKDVDGRADLWSVGAVLFQLITGKHAFDAEGNVQASLAVLTADPQRLRALAPHAPEGLEAVVSRCLTRDVAARFQSAGELAEALRPFASDRAKDSLDRIQSAKEAPCLQIALSVSSTSIPPQADLDSAVLVAGRVDAPTERRIRIAGRAAPPPPPSQAPAARTSPPRARASSLVLAAVGVGSVAVLTVGVAAFRSLGASAERPAARSSVLASEAPSASVLLDAGQASP
ncbi:MAG: serine/threonine protein kinase [Labilithrix sp.]|nr:serine/threonine protein kinase [Labilithrix sp.]